MIGYPKPDTMGFRLERNPKYKYPEPIVGNNYYKNHSQISKKHIYRPFKGPLYNEAGRICIELT
jgi:hypothetical protein